MNNADVIRSINRLEQVLKNWVVEPTIKAQLTHATGPNWMLALVEDWPDDLNRHSSTAIDECVEWVTTRLKDNDRCTRLAWNMWRFKTKRDAEQFLTMFYMVWAQ